LKKRRMSMSETMVVCGIEFKRPYPNWPWEARGVGSLWQVESDSSWIVRIEFFDWWGPSAQDMTPELALKAALRELEGYIKARESGLREARKLAKSLKATIEGVNE